MEKSNTNFKQNQVFLQEALKFYQENGGKCTSFYENMKRIDTWLKSLDVK